MLSFLTHNSHTHPAHMLYILTFPAVSFMVKSDKQGIEEEKRFISFPSEVLLGPGTHMSALLISVSFFFSEISPFRQAAGMWQTDNLPSNILLLFTKLAF